MPDRFLITTADERTWPQDRSVLFLGEWCRRFDRRSAWQGLDAEMVPYHWNDREKLFRDYLDLNVLHEELLRELAEQLNGLHGVDHTIRYWRILIGPWLGAFVQALFDRWSMLDYALKNYAIAGVRVLETPAEEFIPNDIGQFVMFVCGDFWNEGIWSQLIEDRGAIPIEKVRRAETPQSSSALPIRERSRQTVKRTAVQISSFVMQALTRPGESFFLSSYLPRGQDLLLQWRLGQIPKIWTTRETPRSPVAPDQRRWTMPQTNGTGFSSVVRTMIPRQIPTQYVEGYAALNRACSRLPWPDRPRLIFTSNAFMFDDMFKAWAAEKVEQGVPLAIGQHGGHYGSALFTFPEYHQHRISDPWISWGWTDRTSRNVRPVGNLKLIRRSLSSDPNGYALMVEMCEPRYSFQLTAMPVASQWLDYFEFQCRFVMSLPDRLRAELLVRLDKEDYGWSQEQRWHERFPRLRVDRGKSRIARLIKKSRLYISTYNATTYLESLALNIPTIIFWNPRQFELRASAIPDLEQLKSVGIFHQTPESAAHHMAQVWDDVSGWWNTEPTQSVRREFCYRYSRVGENILDDLECSLRDAISANMSVSARQNMPPRSDG